MLKLTTLTFTLIAALSFGATTAQAGMFSGNRAPQPTEMGRPCPHGTSHLGKCLPTAPTGPMFPKCNPHTPCPPDDPATDCAGGSATIYGTTHECP